MDVIWKPATTKENDSVWVSGSYLILEEGSECFEVYKEAHDGDYRYLSTAKSLNSAKAKATAHNS